RVVDINEKNGSDPKDLATSLNNLARILRDEGKYDQAEADYKRALALREKALGPNDPDVGAVLRNYAYLLHKMNREDEAAKLNARAQEIEDHSASTSGGN